MVEGRWGWSGSAQEWLFAQGRCSKAPWLPLAQAQLEDMFPELYVMQLPLRALSLLLALGAQSLEEGEVFDVLRAQDPGRKTQFLLRPRPYLPQPSCFFSGSWGLWEFLSCPWYSHSPQGSS